MQVHMTDAGLCVHADPRPQVPDIQVNFHHDYHFELVMLHVSAISAEMHTAAVSMLFQPCASACAL